MEKCPYCQKPLQKTPARKTRCHHCDEFIFVRTISTKTVLFTQDQVQKYDEERQEQFRAAGHADEIARMLHLCNISEHSYQQQKNDFENKSGPLSREAELRFAWEIVKYQAAIDTQAGNRVEWFSMAIFANRHGWEYRSLLEMAAALELLNLKKMEFVTHVRISTDGNKSCPACQTLENQIFAIDDALQRKILPHKDCSFILYGDQPGFCRCLYLSMSIW